MWSPIDHARKQISYGDRIVKMKPADRTVPKVLVVGPLPPPVNGQGGATLAFVNELERAGTKVARVNTSVGGSQSRVVQLACKVLRNVRAVFVVLGGKSPVYISSLAGPGMWLTVAVCLAARVRHRSQVLHHHSFDYVRERRPRAVALVRAAGPAATHVILGSAMESGLRSVLPELPATFELNNAGLIDPELVTISHSPSNRLVLGHLSNLSSDKGIDEVFRLATSLHEQGIDARLVIAGPAEDDIARKTIELATEQLGSAFTYMGPVAGDKKREFFQEITHFVFPTQYRNEAAPLVLLEAMASGVTCIASNRGCIAEQLEGSGGIAVPVDADFVTEATDFLKAEISSPGPHQQSVRARTRYLELRDDYLREITELISIVRG